MSEREKTAEEEWQEHFDELTDKFKDFFHSVELISLTEFKLKYGDLCSTEEESKIFMDLIQNLKPEGIQFSYGNKRFFYIKELDNQYSDVPFYLFVSQDEDSPGVKRGLIVTEYYGFALAGTFNNVNSPNVVRFFCNYVCNVLNQQADIEE
ncbi:hypothetical protein H312_01450 [Anncaliia algerae PRA339]|uniref:Profilin n=1 Tax=Anncaliia algerae PRA339 TaxID=1288291 RepID=A0A059F1K7_9MICR|nr:hypothetical protein H312_01450 [Anncaliia algerae PRA339]